MIRVYRLSACILFHKWQTNGGTGNQQGAEQTDPGE